MTQQRAVTDTRQFAVMRSAAGLLAAGISALWHTLLEERPRWYLWIPVLLATGSAFYFQLGDEPGPWTLGAAAVIIIAGAALTRRQDAAVAGIAVMLIASGFLIAKARSELVAAPVLPQMAKIYGVTGWIEDIEQRAGGRWRLVVRVKTLDRLGAASQPYRVRVSVHRSAGRDLLPGQLITVRARLRGPAGPSYPGAFDFARRAWFSRIGGFGFAVAAVKPADGPGTQPVDIAVLSLLEEMRRHIAMRIKQNLTGTSGAVAVALITGKRGAIPSDTLQSIRDAGLGHLLAISGLHMVLMAGSLFWLIRALLALVPWLALNQPIKKWSAVVALAGGAAYLALSGAAVSTQRAYIMLAVMFLAVLIDRPAISLRNVATAALIVLLLRPESILDVGFQMSFATVTALVALYNMRSDLIERRKQQPSAGKTRRLVWRGTTYLGGILITTLVATLVTGPIAAFHFNRIALYGLAANIIAIPLMGIAIMPLAGLALIAMPFGAEAPFLYLMGQGIDVVIATANKISHLPGAVAVAPQTPAWPVVLFICGGLWLCLWQLRWRYWAVPVIVAGLGAVAFAGKTEPFDILVDRELDIVAMRNRAGDLTLSSSRGGRYTAERWLRMDGDGASMKQAANRPGLNCDDFGCVGELAAQRTLSIVRHPAIINEECLSATVLITRIAPRGPCPVPKIIITRRDLFANGAHGLTWNGSKYKVTTVREKRGDRPWSQVVPWRTGNTPRRPRPGGNTANAGGTN